LEGGGDVQSHLHPIGHVHDQLLGEKAPFLFWGSWDIPLFLEKAKFENAARFQILENAACSQEGAKAWERWGFWG
jgi:hypothetical protein